MGGNKRGASTRHVKRFMEKRKKVVTRSKFEDSGIAILTKHKVNFEYEPKDKRLSYTVPAKTRKYLPDLVVGNTFYELKGYLRTLEERMKYLHIAEQNPHIELVMVFQNPNLPIAKRSKTTYKLWFEKHGIKTMSIKEFENKKWH